MHDVKCLVNTLLRHLTTRHLDVVFEIILWIKLLLYLSHMDCLTSYHLICMKNFSFDPWCASIHLPSCAKHTIWLPFFVLFTFGQSFTTTYNNFYKITYDQNKFARWSGSILFFLDFPKNTILFMFESNNLKHQCQW